MKLILLLEEVNKDLLKSTAMRFVNKLDISDYEDYKAWLKLINVSGKPRIPLELKIDYKQLNNSLSMLVDYEKTASKFSDPEQKYLKFIISSGHNALKRIGSEHLISLIDILYKGSGSTVKSKTSEIKIANYIFINDSQMAESRFKETSNELADFLNTFKGFHKKALVGTLEVHFKSTKVMRARATYKSDLDQIWIREGSSREFASTVYASLKYIISHELGHRYEKKVGQPGWFNNNDWDTTRYSRTSESWDGEQFAEIFALSFWGSSKYPEYKDKIEKFINKMG